MKIMMMAFTLLFTGTVMAQTNDDQPTLAISGYLEIYYSYDFGQPKDHKRPAFLYSFNRHNEVNVNLGYIKAAYQTKYARANLAFMAGTYTNANLAAEPGVLKNIFEANAGVKISKKNNLWIDAGIFASHIGFESAVGKDCWNLTRGILGDNSPYYETGVKISYTSNNDKWFFSGLVLNGWQRIQRPEDNNTPAFGHQVTFKPGSKTTLNWSSFLGSDKPDSASQMRYFNNFYGIFQLTDRLAITAGFDVGVEEGTEDKKEYNNWYSPVIVLRYNPAAKNSIAIRGEYYKDAKGVIISTNNPHGFRTWGYSINYDYQIRDNILWRIEVRGFTSKDDIYTKNDLPVNNNFCLTTSLAISIQ